MRKLIVTVLSASEFNEMVATLGVKNFHFGTFMENVEDRGTSLFIVDDATKEFAKKHRSEFIESFLMLPVYINMLLAFLILGGKLEGDSFIIERNG